MPIKITDSSHGSEIYLDNLEFVIEDNIRYFRLSNAEDNEIRISYIPKDISSWDINRYDIFLLENPYLGAENDVFEVYETTISRRLGWVFPISTLESNDNNYVDHHIFKNYRYVAYWKLLQQEVTFPENQSRKSDYKLSELFQNICVCILSKDETKLIPEFKITDYILSFLNYDYLLYNGSIKGKAIYDKSSYLGQLRSTVEKKIVIRKSLFNVIDNQYTKSLFLEHLIQSENYLVRYILLYQILEDFMELEADKNLETEIKKYHANQISRQKFKENLSKLAPERSLIIKIFQNNSIPIEIKTDFLAECNFIFTELGRELSTDFENALYDLRNLITHSYRLITHQTEKLKNIVLLVEKIITYLLLYYKAPKAKLLIAAPINPNPENNPTIPLVNEPVKQIKAKQITYVQPEKKGWLRNFLDKLIK